MTRQEEARASEANQAKVPETCGTRSIGSGEVVTIRRGFRGYWPMARDFDPDAFNAARGITPAQVAAMTAGSMFGWHVPAADPDRYTADGKLKAT